MLYIIHASYINCGAIRFPVSNYYLLQSGPRDVRGFIRFQLSPCAKLLAAFIKSKYSWV